MCHLQSCSHSCGGHYGGGGRPHSSWKIETTKCLFPTAEELELEEDESII
jgi:hypothetical protein